MPYIVCGKCHRNWKKQTISFPFINVLPYDKCTKMCRLVLQKYIWSNNKKCILKANIFSIPLFKFTKFMMCQRCSMWHSLAYIFPNSGFYFNGKVVELLRCTMHLKIVWLITRGRTITIPVWREVIGRVNEINLAWNLVFAVMWVTNDLMTLTHIYPSFVVPTWFYPL